MKNLDLKQIGVQELSTVEKRDVDGGWILLALYAAGVYFAWETISNPSASWNAYQEGLAAGQNY